MEKNESFFVKYVGGEVYWKSKPKLYLSLVVGISGLLILTALLPFFIAAICLKDGMAWTCRKLNLLLDCDDVFSLLREFGETWKVAANAFVKAFVKKDVKFLKEVEDDK